MLILFDIDGTLILTGGAGLDAMHVAGRRLHGEEFSLDGVDFAGRLDPLIWADAAKRSGIDDPAAHHDDFRAAYAEALAERLRDRPTSEALPGAMALVDRLAAEALSLGLLTGNYPETGRIKLEAAGFDMDRFPVAAWGCDAPARRDLPPVAIERHRAHSGATVRPEDVVIIGDTPHDVECAHAHGCRVIAVPTGPRHSRDDLAACDPDLLVDDLTDVDALVEWIAGGVRA